MLIETNVWKVVDVMWKMFRWISFRVMVLKIKKVEMEERRSCLASFSSSWTLSLKGKDITEYYLLRDLILELNR